MKPNKEKILELINSNFKGNQSAFANAIGVDRAQVSKVVNTGTCAGAQFFGGLLVYCECKGLDFKDYIFLPESVKKINR